MLRLLVSAGGTGGGVYPALAVVAALGEKADVLWVGGRGGMEAGLVGRAGIAFQAIPAAGLHGVGLRALPSNALQLARGVPAARRVIKRFKPDVLFFTGGYVGVPVSVAGRRLPQAVFVPDVEPALALRLITRRADLIALSTPDSRRCYNESAPVVVTGYPLRSEMQVVDARNARRSFGLAPEERTLLVYGGSRGARSINEALWANMERVLGVVQVLHITGELDWPRVADIQAGLTASQLARYRAHAYLHDRMAQALSAADLALTRSGAATLGELPRFGLPAILVPYPHAWRYQRVNADYLADHGGAIVVEDATLTARLPELVADLFEDAGQLERMRSASRGLDKPDAAAAIAAEIARLFEERSAAHG
ncbi:MAG: UDP-N-acetylglucosamine--N-acetylmuramyl-(pentapeptide) pyrophosphoryl-undecaprenol N-acetylglucosamine transferase [Anaerolineales bacterium]